jgi:phage recombination protein Bet
MSNIAEFKQEPKSLVVQFANKYSVDPDKLLSTLKSTAFKQQGTNQVSNEQMMALLVVASQYNLNPFTREIYAFPQNGGVVPIVPIDGWMKIINNHPNFDGMQFRDQFNDKGDLVAITCAMFRKDRSHPVEVTEYMSECSRNTDPWKKWPARMLRHKAAIQAARYAFSFSGIYDPDEGERMQESNTDSFTQPALHEPTPEQKEHFDHLIEAADALGMYMFSLAMREISDNVWISLYHTFPKGQKGKYQKVVDELCARGFSILRDIVDGMRQAIAAGDDMAAKELTESLDKDALRFVAESLGQMDWSAAKELAGI